MRKNNPQATRELLLQAAATIIVENGAHNLTLESVAKHASISKGGLLHHFPNKENLLLELMNHLMQTFEQNLEQQLEPNPSPGRWTRAYIRTTFIADPEEQKLTQALSSLVVSHPQLIQHLKNAFAFAEERILSDGLPAARATAIRLACDGMWFGEIGGMISIKEPLRQELLEELLEMAKE
jgi:AcrR family transcriptional regulator